MPRVAAARAGQPGKTPGKAPGKTPGKTPGKIPSKTPGGKDKLPGGVGKLPGKTVTETTNQIGIIGQEEEGEKATNRLMMKSGEVNATPFNSTMWNPFTFNNIVKLNWFTMFHLVLSSLVITWNCYGLLYYIMEMDKGNVCEEHNEGKECAAEVDYEDAETSSCITFVTDFVGALLFSIETQQTIGYGKRFAHPEGCEYVTVVVAFQAITGIIVTTILTGIVFVKFSRPKDRVNELIFSNIGVVTQRNEELCLLIRIADRAKYRLVGSQVDAILYKSATTQEGEHIILQPHTVHFGFDLLGGDADVLLIWPLCISHRIDKYSPFYDMKPPFDKNSFELIIWISGTSVEDGALVQGRTSYIQDEIMWGYKFCKKLSKKSQDLVAYFDEDSINKITKDNLSIVTGRELDRIKLFDKGTLETTNRRQSSNSEKQAIKSEAGSTRERHNKLQMKSVGEGYG